MHSDTSKNFNLRKIAKYVRAIAPCGRPHEYNNNQREEHLIA